MSRPGRLATERTCRQTLFCNRAARVKGSKLAPAPRMAVWQGPLFCPRSAQAAAASWSQAWARCINTLEAARSARSNAAEGLSMSPSPCVPAGRFRRSGTRALAEAGRMPALGSRWRSGNAGRRSDGGEPASEREGVKADEAPRWAGIGLTPEPPDA